MISFLSRERERALSEYRPPDMPSFCYLWKLKRASKRLGWPSRPKKKSKDHQKENCKHLLCFILGTGDFLQGKAQLFCSINLNLRRVLEKPISFSLITFHLEMLSTAPGYKGRMTCQIKTDCLILNAWFTQPSTPQIHLLEGMAAHNPSCLSIFGVASGHLIFQFHAVPTCETCSNGLVFFSK